MATEAAGPACSLMLVEIGSLAFSLGLLGPGLILSKTAAHLGSVCPYHMRNWASEAVCLTYRRIHSQYVLINSQKNTEHFCVGKKKTFQNKKKWEEWCWSCVCANICMACLVESNSFSCLPLFCGPCIACQVVSGQLHCSAQGHRREQTESVHCYWRHSFHPEAPESLPALSPPVLCAVFIWIRYMCPLDRLLLVTKPPSPLKAGLDSAVSTSHSFA